MDGLGSTFWRENDDASPVFEQIAGVISFGEFDATAATFDNSRADQTDRIMRSGKGMIDAGEFELTLGFKDAGTDAAYDALLDADLASVDDRRYRVQLPTTGKTAITFTALVTGVGLAFPVGDRMARKVKFKRQDLAAAGVWV